MRRCRISTPPFLAKPLPDYGLGRERPIFDFGASGSALRRVPSPGMALSLDLAKGGANRRACWAGSLPSLPYAPPAIDQRIGVAISNEINGTHRQLPGGGTRGRLPAAPGCGAWAATNGALDSQFPIENRTATY